MSAELAAIFTAMEVPCTVRDDPRKGKRVVATRDLPAETTLFEEVPIVSWSFASREPRSFCDWCLVSLGARLPAVSCGFGGGGACACAAVYCSDACRARAAPSHAFLCGAPLTAVRAFDAALALTTADEGGLPITLEALARAVASVAARYVGAARANPGAAPADLFPAAARLFSRLVSCPDGAEYEEIDSARWFAALRAAVRDRVAGTLAAAAVSETAVDGSGADAGGDATGHAEAVDALLSDDTLGVMLGQLALNSHALNLPVPSPSAPGAVAGAIDRNDDDDDDDAAAHCDAPAPIRPSVGAGVFALHSCLNHSGAPNAYVVFSVNNEIAVRLRRAVAAGDEITITYIPELFLRLERFEARRARLANYFFTCDCECCVAEETAAAATAAPSAVAADAAAAAAAGSASSS